MIDTRKDVIVNKSTNPIEETTAKAKEKPYTHKDFKGRNCFVFHFSNRLLKRYGLAKKLWITSAMA